MWFAHHTILGKRIRAVASNPMLADITRLQPQTVYIYVIAIASALVCAELFLKPLLRAMMGADPEPRFIKARLGEPLTSYVAVRSAGGRLRQRSPW